MTSLQHPDVHSPWSAWSEQQTLHVAVAYSNPFRWRSRRRLMNDFRRNMQCMPNVVLHVGELAYGDRPWEVTTIENPLDVQLRTQSELFHKENILNEVIRTFPSDWAYGAYIDADFSFTRHDWALETIHQLQHSPWVQPYSSYGSLDANAASERQREGFAAKYIANGYALPQDYDGGWAPEISYEAALALKKPVWIPVGATGGAWAFTRPAFTAVGGLLDICILGHADWFMAFGLVSQPTRGTIAQSKFTLAYTKAIISWQQRAGGAFKANIGKVDQFAVHHYHGDMRRRGYGTRDQILVDCAFDPITDLRRNWQGIYELTDTKPKLRDAIRQYFLDRREDEGVL